MKMKAGAVVAFAMSALAELWGYVLGGQGEMWTKNLAEAWAKSRNKPSSWAGTRRSYFVVACARWLGHRITDCSGLIIAALRSQNPKYPDQTANGLYSRCSEKGSIKTIPEIPGLCVHKSGHIGVYVGGGYVIESRGVKYGVVRTRLKDRPWTGWGKLSDVDYSEYENQKPVMPMLKKGSTGDKVRLLQQLLNEKIGVALKVDGIFGSRTRNAVLQYQKKFSLEADGIVGPITWASLGY